MSRLSSVINDFSSSIIKDGFDVIKAYFPQSMSEEEKEKAKVAYKMVVSEKKRQADVSAVKVECEVGRKLQDMEGTASDLKAIPYLGNVIVFIRGAQRPVWGCFTMFADLMVFSKRWNLTEEPELKSMLFAINILVLGFLFGERAVKNLMPFFREFLSKRK